MKTLIAAALSVLAVGCASSSPYLAKVNGEGITGTDLKAEFKKRHGGHEKFLYGDVEARKFLDKVVDWKLLIQEAYRLGLQDQEDIRKATDEFQEKKELEYLLKTEIEDKSVPTKDEIRVVWERDTVELLELRHIAVDAKEDADALYLQLLAGGDLDGLARACSTSQSRMYGGKLPLIGWGALDPALESVAFSLSAGDTAPPVRTASGWEIVRVEEIHPVTRPELEKASPRIEGILKKRKLEERKRAISELLFTKYHVVLAEGGRSPEALRKLLETAPGTALATWDGGKLTVKDFVSKEELAALSRVPVDRVGGHVEELLRQTINDALARREAKERNLAQVPDVAEPVTRFREELMERALYADYVLRDVTVSDSDVRADFEAHKGDWITPERRRVAQIVVKTREQALEVRKKLVNGESFVDIAKAESLDTQTAKIGGDLGFVMKRNVPKEFLAILDLKEGEVSEPVETKFGWHLVKIVAIEPPKQMEFEAAKDEVAKKLLETRKTETRAKWVGKLRAAASIEVNNAKLHAFAKENSVN